ncbi:cytochrome c oxidase assembly protein [Mesorhizobium loti]|uniref:cytochrome c oxidase assembly protein n=1 Tax=Rhizobium loti TaxID=381 RepID=UPI00047BB0CA|nr:cytochrome c oxidase assembly protein [Mesorhizobium loti]
MPTLILMTFLLIVTGPALAHGDEVHGPGIPWTFDLWVVVPLATLTWLYGAGMLTLAGRGRLLGRRRGRHLMFGVGMLTLAGALLSPLHWLGERLFSVHMVEHEIVMAVSAPLVVLARPIGILLWGIPGTARRVVATLIRSPLIRGAWDGCTGSTTATIIHGAAIWAWHMPLLFDAAVINTALHRLQHLSFFATAILFWWAMLWRSDYGTAAWHLFVTMLHTSLLGALMALAPRVLYVAQTRTAMEWGLTPLEDQQLAGMIMWVPAGTVYAGAALAMLALWIGRSSDRRIRNG